MKKFYTLLTALLCAATMMAQTNVPRTKIAYKAPSNAAAFSFSDIKNWSGEGSYSAALALKWTGSEYTWVFGYHFDGEKTGADMIMEIAANNPRFFVLAASTAYGTTVGGFGWDADNNGFELKDANGNTVTADERGVYTISGTNFDSYTAASEADFWNSGWMSKGYWSYNIATNPAEKISYASTGCTGRKLADGVWDLWLFSPFSGETNTWGDFVAVPANQETPTAIDDVAADKTIASVKYVNLAGQMSDTAFEGVNIVVTTYTDGTKATAKCVK
ncbi:MAG: hypothetical protein Q4B68_01535 [Bacteroidales bacterium]|nr:hypothetical protein [Bacteroidales bacterium]